LEFLPSLKSVRNSIAIEIKNMDSNITSSKYNAGSTSLKQDKNPYMKEEERQHKTWNAFHIL